MRMMRCLAVLSIAVPGKATEHYWPGLEVNFDREIKPGYTVADAVKGKAESYFTPAVAIEHESADPAEREE